MSPIKRILALLMCICLLPLFVFGEEEDEEGLFAYPNIPVELRPGDLFALPEAPVSWSSDAPEVALIEDGAIKARNEGFATIVCVNAEGLETLYDVTVDENALPFLIRGAIDLALSEWEENLGKTFTDRNKYTKWYCGNGKGCHFGWCGGFVGYCLDKAGVPMDDYTVSCPHEGGVPYAVFAAGVGKILRGYTKMERLSEIPRPGYLVIYGQRKRSDTIHVGMITDVTDRGDGTYVIRTVEGNVSSRIKRYCYLFDSSNTDQHNYSALPDEEWTERDIYQYKIHQKDWFIYTFCATWLPEES